MAPTCDLVALGPKSNLRVANLSNVPMRRLSFLCRWLDQQAFLANNFHNQYKNKPQVKHVYALRKKYSTTFEFISVCLLFSLVPADCTGSNICIRYQRPGGKFRRLGVGLSGLLSLHVFSRGEVSGVPWTSTSLAHWLLLP